MAKKTIEYTLEEQLAVKKSIIEEFKLIDKTVSQEWLDTLDINPDPKNPSDWDFLLYSKEKECYINLKFFPRITIEPTHTANYNYGVLNYTKGMPIDTVLWYLHNILDERD